MGTNNSIISSDDQADLSRYISQTKSLLVSVSDDDQIAKLGTTNIINILWLVSDRVADIKSVSNKLLRQSSSEV